MTLTNPASARGELPASARLIAELQALSLALRIGGLDGLRTGEVHLNPEQSKEPHP